MNKALVAIAVLAGVAGGFAGGYYMASKNSQAAFSEQSGELLAAEKNIRKLEKKLAAEKTKVSAPQPVAQAPAEVVREVVQVSNIETNTDIMSELKKQLPAEQFEAATNAFANLRAKLAEKAKGRIEYLADVDVSGMSKAERDNHKKYLKMLEKREKIASKMKSGIPDNKTLEEMLALELEMQELAKKERSALVRELSRQLGYTGDDVETLHDTLDAIFDCTSGGGLGGLGDIAEGEPGISIQTQVIGI